jgi:hypothetical protein
MRGYFPGDNPGAGSQEILTEGGRTAFEQTHESSAPPIARASFGAREVSAPVVAPALPFRRAAAFKSPHANAV